LRVIVCKYAGYYGKVVDAVIDGNLVKFEQVSEPNERLTN
jgi:hypothetical protein